MARLLVIDDSAAMREMLIECLKHEHEVVTAQDGSLGIEIAKVYRPDLVICDLAMPIMDGFSVLQHFQTMEEMSDVPFIFLSASGDHNTVRHGMTLGADDYLTKPFSIGELLRVVRNRLEKRTRRQVMITKAIDELRLNITTALPHELRTAIMMIEGYAYLVLEDADKIDDVQRQMLESIRENAARLRNMSEKYLWYLKSYLPAKAKGNFVVQHPDQLIQTVAFEVAQRFNRIEDLSLYLEKCQIQMSDDYLSKIVEEIIENAFKFSKAETPVSIQGIVRSQEYVITISDLGQEITQDQIERIGGFMQFDRAKYEQQGTGLGLIIAKRLTELNGGALTISSSDGETRIIITLPFLVTENQEDLLYA